jgi:1-deoxy-D-xylulose-5-phosphate synthase
MLSFGSMLEPALQAAEELDATVVNMRFVKPLDEDLVQRLAKNHELLVTLEENVVQGGAGSAVNECLAGLDQPVRTLNLGLPDRFVDQASSQQQLAECGLDSSGIVRSITLFQGEHLLPGQVAGAGNPA